MAWVPGGPPTGTQAPSRLGLVPTMCGIRNRGEIAENLEHISHLIKAGS